MPYGILLSDNTLAWDVLEAASRQTCHDLSFERALNIVRIMPYVARYGLELEADRRRLEHWCKSMLPGLEIDEWREMVDRHIAAHG